MVIEEELSCEREIVNAHHTHAYAVHNIIDGDTYKNCWTSSMPTSALYLIFIRRSGSILCKAKGIADTPRICHSIDSTFSVRRIAIATIYAQTQPTKSS